MRFDRPPRPEGAGRGIPAADVRHHLPPRRREDHAHREVPALRRRDRRGRGRARPEDPAGRRPPTGWSWSGSAASPSPRPSCSSTYQGHVVNLLDTPGHQDFSEDTYRTLAAADSAVMVIDAAKGVEPQTQKLFQVVPARGIPILTFINKMDRPGPRPAGPARARSSRSSGIDAVPDELAASDWGTSSAGVYDRDRRPALLFARPIAARCRCRPTYSTSTPPWTSGLRVDRRTAVRRGTGTARRGRRAASTADRFLAGRTDPRLLRQRHDQLRRRSRSSTRFCGWPRRPACGSATAGRSRRNARRSPGRCSRFRRT